MSNFLAWAEKVTLREEILAGRKFGGFGGCRKIINLAGIEFGGEEKNKIIAEFNLANNQNNLYFFELKNMFYKHKRKS